MANSTALDIANMFSDSFETVVAIETFDKAVLQATGLSSNKIICEICLFFHLAHDVIATRRSLLAKVERFITESREYVLDSKTMSYIERFPAGVHLVGLILLCSNTYNLKSQRLELLEQAIRSPAYLCAERLPFRYQESVWLYEQITSQALHDQNCRSALLSRITHPSVLSRNDLYAKTHTVMYETNFGRRYISEPYDNSAIKLSMCHDLNLSFCNADWDLVGEICMANRFLGNFYLPSAQCLLIRSLIE